MYKTVTESVPWTDKTEWLWPEADEKMLGVFYMSAEIDEVIKHVPQQRVVVQAGGDAGIWPMRLAQIFDQVYTFEPQPLNWHCLTENCHGIENIYAQHAALSDKRQTVEIINKVSDRNNFGAGYIVEADEGVPTMLIDDMDLTVCDLIYLDIEGAELDALRGAEETIKRCRPVICFEDKPLPWMPVFNRLVGDPGRWLSKLDYKLVEKIHWDYVWMPT